MKQKLEFEIRKPDKLAYTIMLKRFPFLREICEKHGEWVQDIYQIGFLCYYETNGDNRMFWNSVQREFYSLAKALGFRRTRKNEWKYKESNISNLKKEELKCL